MEIPSGGSSSLRKISESTRAVINKVAPQTIRFMVAWAKWSMALFAPVLKQAPVKIAKAMEMVEPEIAAKALDLIANCPLYGIRVMLPILEAIEPGKQETILKLMKTKIDC